MVNLEILSKNAYGLKLNIFIFDGVLSPFHLH